MTVIITITSPDTEINTRVGYFIGNARDRDETRWRRPVVYLSGYVMRLHLINHDGALEVATTGIICRDLFLNMKRRLNRPRYIMENNKKQ